MIDFEVGSVDFWVTVGDKGKPFPVTVYRSNGDWIHDAYPSKAFTEKEQIEVSAFVKERISDLRYLWKSNMTTRLRWGDSPTGKSTHEKKK